MIVRDAQTTDATGILAIYNPVIANSATSFEMDCLSEEEMVARIAQSTWVWPWIVAEENETITGYAYARPFRSRPAYRHSVETTVYIHHDYHRRGIGSLLMRHLLIRLDSAGHVTAIAGVTLPNAGSVGLHEALGFRSVGVFPAVGRKYDAWHDVGFWSLPITADVVDVSGPLARLWRMRLASPNSTPARTLMRQHEAELEDRYDEVGKAWIDFDPDSDDGRSAFVVGWLDDQPVACGAVRPLSDDVAELKRLFVSPSARGQGLGTQVVGRLEIEAQKLGYRSLRLETGDRQPEAIRLYEKLGYVRIPCFGKYADCPGSVCFEQQL